MYTELDGSKFEIYEGKPILTNETGGAIYENRAWYAFSYSYNGELDVLGAKAFTTAEDAFVFGKNYFS